MGFCISDITLITLNILVYGTFLIVVLLKHYKTIGWLTSTLLTLPLFQYAIVYVFTSMMVHQLRQ